MIRRIAARFGYRIVCGKVCRYDRHRVYDPCECGYHRRLRVAAA